MNIFSNFIEKERWEKSLKRLSHIDFTLFYDYRPNQKEIELAPINIFIACEPNEYFYHHDFAIQNKDAFSFILTWSEKVLNNADNAILSIYGESWWQDQPYEIDNTVEKEFAVSFLRGNKIKLYGHSLRFELWDRQRELTTPLKFWDSLGDPNDWESWRQSKIDSFRPYMFSLCIENTSHENYFTEKITDCILNRTVPIYWGCSNIGDFYDMDGIIHVRNVDEMVKAINNLTPESYYSRMDAIDKNYELALGYKDYAGNVAKQIEGIFKNNNII